MLPHRSASPSRLGLDTPNGPRLLLIDDHSSPHGVGRLASLLASACLAAVLLVAGLSLFGNSGATPAAAVQNPASTDRVLVKFKSNASQKAVAAVTASLGASKVDDLGVIGVSVLKVPNLQSALAGLTA